MATRKGLFHDLSRGADTALHSSKMALWSLIWISLIGVIICASIAGYYFLNRTDVEQRSYSTVYLKASFWHVLSSDRVTINFLDGEGNPQSVRAGEIYRNQEFRSHAGDVWSVTKGGLKKGAVVGGITSLSLIGLAVFRGQRLRQDSLLRGGSLEEAEVFANELIKDGVASDICLGQIPMIKGSEPQHIFITGTPGTGKSVLIASMLDVIRARGDRAIIYDSSGDYLRHFWKSGDVILNPLDERSESWTPWAEIRESYDADQLAASLIPEKADQKEPFWTDAARSLLAAALQRVPTRTVSFLLNYLLTTNLSSLASLVGGTDAAAIVGEGNEKTALSVRATLATYVRSLRFLNAGAVDNPFSIRKWIEAESSSCMFITSRADQHESLRPLISCWLDVAANSIMSLPPDRSRRIWIILDELPHLNKMPAIPRVLAMGRKYGACGVLGIQTVAQIREIYGKDGGEALTGLTNTWAVFRTPDPDTAEWTSRALGEGDIDETQESLSYSAEETRDGISLRQERQTRRVVMPTEIMRFKDLEACLRLPGEYPITKIKLVPKNRAETAQPYVPTDLSKTAWSSFESDIPLSDGSEKSSSDNFDFGL